MFGGGLVWLYRNLAGMKADPEKPGYRHIIFRPQVVGSLDFVTYKNDTPYGEAGITWRLENAQLSMDITVPIGSTATVYIPASEGDKVTESGSDARLADGVNFLRNEDGYSIFEVQSGSYGFKVN